jgi:hypothetical protein
VPRAAKEVVMNGDLKEIVGTLMRVLDGGTISCAEVEGLAFDAEGDLRIALNEAYIALMEFAWDCEGNLRDPQWAEETKAVLQQCLDKIVRCADAV